MMRTRFLPLALVLLSSLASAREPRLAHWIEGKENDEKVVLIHGYTSSHATWAALVPVLAKRYQVLTYDQPGHGKSAAEGADYSPQHMAEELKDLMEDLKFDKAHIVGHSMGGRTAVKFAALYPEKVSSLVVEDMNFLSDPGMKAQLLFARGEFAKFLDGMPSHFKTLNEGVTNLYLVEGLSLDMTDELKAIRSRVAFFAADPKEESAVLKTEGLEHIRKTRPDAQVKVFPGSGHTIHGRADFAEALLSFLVSP